MAKAQQNWGAFVLHLLGSLIFLGVVFIGLPAAGVSVAGAFGNGAGAFWGPIFVGAAVIASVALFFSSFGHISGWEGPRFQLMGLGTDAVAGMTMAALTWSSSTWLWASILAFVLTFLGNAMGRK